MRSLLSLPVFFSVISCGILLSTHVARAVPPDGSVTGITLLDNDENAFADTIRFSVANPTGRTWELDGALPYGFSVTQDGEAIGITDVDITSATDANPIVIAVTLDPSYPPLQQTTDGVNDAPIEFIYSQVGGGAACANCVHNGVDTELFGIASGDTDLGDIEIDGMEPVLLYTYFNTASGTYNYNAVDFAFSEPIFISLDGDGGVDLSSMVGGSGYSTATFGAMTTARTISGLGSWGATNGGDYAGSSATANSVITYFASNQGHLTIVLNSANDSYFNAGTTAPTTPTFTIAPNPLVIFDAAGQGLVPISTGMYVNSAWDVTKPTVSTTYSCDTDTDGNIDRVQVNFSETVNTTSLASSTFELDNDDTNNATGEETPASWNTQTYGCDGNANDSDAIDEKISFDLGTGISGTDPAYLHYTGTGVAFVKDGPGNLLTSGSALGTESDRAAPVVTASTPEDGGSLARSANITLTFSEAMDITTENFTYTLTGSPTLSRAWSGGNTILTLSGTKTRGANTLTITAAPDANARAFGSILATEDASLSFTVYGGSSSAPVVPYTYAIDLISPTGGADYAQGESIPIRWTTLASSGSVAAVDIAYSVDGGATHVPVAVRTENDGAYDWTPNISLGENVLIRVEGNDLVTVLATDFSDVFSIGRTSSVSDNAEEVDDDDDAAATFIKGESWSAVYYVTSDGYRHPFLNERIFATYADTFDTVVTVSDAELANYPLGNPIGPKPGTMLVKVQSVPKVFTVGGTPEAPLLRWIATESLATDLYGGDWADYVIDVPPTMWSHLSFGEDVETLDAIDVDLTAMLRREELAAL